MTNIYIDCEFNGFGGELISMALVAEDGEQFYEVIELLDYITPWVAENVMPILNKDSVSFSVFQTKLQQFLHRYPSVHIIADWPDDIKYFCQALISGPGTRINTPPLTMEILKIDAVSKLPHNALEDAIAIAEYMAGVSYE
jgi:hypothetical protein